MMTVVAAKNVERKCLKVFKPYSTEQSGDEESSIFHRSCPLRNYFRCTPCYLHYIHVCYLATALARDRIVPGTWNVFFLEGCLSIGTQRVASNFHFEAFDSLSAKSNDLEGRFSLRIVDGFFVAQLHKYLRRWHHFAWPSSRCGCHTFRWNWIGSVGIWLFRLWKKKIMAFDR